MREGETENFILSRDSAELIFPPPQKFTRPPCGYKWYYDGNRAAVSLPSKGGVTSSSETPPLVKEEALFQNVTLGKNRNVVMDPNWAQYRERLFWQWPAAIHWTGQVDT